MRINQFITCWIIIITLLFANDKSMTKPHQFQFNQSTIQAFYFVKKATILGDPIDKEDWIASFNDTVCVGSRKWNGQYTDVPAMGFDNSTYSHGYLIPGNTPLFYIYDKSENSFYLAKTNYTKPFGRGMAQIFHIDSLYVDYDCKGNLGGQAKYDRCGVCNGNEAKCSTTNSQGQ